MENKNGFDTVYIKVKKENAQDFLNLIKKKLKNKEIIDPTKKILNENHYILFPLLEDEKIVKKIIKIIEHTIDFEITKRYGVFKSNNKNKTIRDALKDKLPFEILKLIPSSYDIIGNIAILEFDQLMNLNDSLSKLNKYKKIIAKTLITINRAIKTVYEKKSEIKGEYRLRELKFLCGEKKSETIHKENQCSFKLDIKNTYFTPRLVQEHRRISSYPIKEKIIIIDMFAGIGSFSIQLAKNNDVKVYAFDVNPYAYKYLRENITLNKLKGKVIPFNIDVREILNSSNYLSKKLKNKADRIIMNLPEKSVEYIDVTCFLMKLKGGILHYYQFCEKPNSVKKAINTLEQSLIDHKYVIEKIIKSKVVKAFSPKSDLVVVDLIIRPNEKKSLI